MRALIATVAAVALAGTAALAQQQEKKAPAEAATFAKKVAAANTFEIQSSELAKERAQSTDVKSFADKMIADHTKAGQEFKAAVKAANVSPPPAEQPDAKQKAALSKLQKAQGPAFDRAYVDAQLKAHKEAVSLFRNYSKKGRTAELKSFAEKTLPTLEHHLSMVQQLNSQGVAGAKGSGGRALSPSSGMPQQRDQKR
jgi:putative membrane protein